MEPTNIYMLQKQGKSLIVQRVCSCIMLHALFTLIGFHMNIPKLKTKYVFNV